MSNNLPDLQNLKQQTTTANYHRAQKISYIFPYFPKAFIVSSQTKVLFLVILQVKSGTPQYSVRNLFNQLILANKPIVVHNGFLDLVFLYENLYCKLPDKLQVFTADLAEMFPAGVFDTKFVSEYSVREPASFLLYIFKKWWVCEKFFFIPSQGEFVKQSKCLWLVIISSVFMILFNDSVVLLLGEIRCWSLRV